MILTDIHFTDLNVLLSSSQKALKENSLASHQTKFLSFHQHNWMGSITCQSISAISIAYHIIHFKPQDKFPHIPSQSWRTAIFGKLPGSWCASMLNNCGNQFFREASLECICEILINLSLEYITLQVTIANQSKMARKPITEFCYLYSLCAKETTE